VIVITGKDKGKRGNVQRVIDNERVIVEGVNMIKRHTKPNPNLGKQGGIVEREAAIAISNIAIFNPKTQKADKVGIKVAADGKRTRIYKSDQNAIG